MQCSFEGLHDFGLAPERSEVSGPMSWEILEGDCREVLASLPERSVQTVVTSPPYFGLRDYGTGEWEGGDEGCDHNPGRTAHMDRSSTLGGGHDSQKSGDTYRDQCGK
jgi:DNA modification methylase